ncbi:MAG: exodeoxyribonuclease VII small subunit [Ignavibacteria bacterium]|mgnify:CR=1 FL=1|nr:exodeoxyribonuclease VII small subunit [Ignavibacteria bacterium]MBK7158652.1 exodeoxyribonuclease VII small subunit [Ignavibacteria bacterium]MBK7254563.1 exodeoxyribonuclease VII small subunit [Ignavibacteria bacterium]MBK7447079.1 exodeoxyribonuclease VII small subunit [Ignavibacteria bacterium]MBK8380861.1 exodeoxyribonuclease VII small subunit [Ignavibacteria bacterium]
MEKKKSTAKKTSGFQDSFKRLEEILEKLENEVEDSSLEEIINYYQEGLKLLKECRDKLSEAELKIEKISTEESI